VSRYAAYAASLVMFVVSLLLALRMPGWWWGVAVFGALAALGTVDLLQARSTLRRNYPILAHFRYGLESIGPEMRQYFIESDLAEVPFSRQQRALVYQRAKRVNDVRPFGTQQNVYGVDYEWINHSMAPCRDRRIARLPHPDWPDSAQPYSASVFNISAMSFGSLSAAAIRALNAGREAGRFLPRHRRGLDLAVPPRGRRRPGLGDRLGLLRLPQRRRQLQRGALRRERARSAGEDDRGEAVAGRQARPRRRAARGQGQRGNLGHPRRADGPGLRVAGAHSAFSTPVELLQFVARLRELSGGKPTGFKLAIGHPWEWFGIAKAMQETGIRPDFIVVDGAEGGTGAAPAEFIDHVGVPMHEALMLVHNTLVGLDLRDRIRIGAAGKIVSAFDIARTLAMGADWCNAARGYMFALGCIQSQSCHTDRCPTGIATQDPGRWRKLDVPDKAVRVASSTAIR
jgi:glutamate synthase domain-containing protein 2